MNHNPIYKTAALQMLQPKVICNKKYFTEHVFCVRWPLEHQWAITARPSEHKESKEAADRE